MSALPATMRRQLQAMAKEARAQGATSIATHLAMLADVRRIDPCKPARLAVLHATVTGRALRYSLAARGLEGHAAMVSAFHSGTNK